MLLLRPRKTLYGLHSRISKLEDYIRVLENNANIDHDPRKFVTGRHTGLVVLGDEGYASDCQFIDCDVVVHPDAKHFVLTNCYLDLRNKEGG